MRVATYTQPSQVTRGSLVAILILILTVALGSSALHSLMTYFVPQMHAAIALLWLLLYFGAFFGLMFNHGINWISWLVRYRILLVILLFGTAFSITWALDVATSAERIVHLLGCSVLAVYLGFMVPLLTTLRVSAVVLGLIMVLCIASAHLMPEVGLENYEGQIVWRGILNSKNALGFWAAISVLLFMTLADSTHTLFMRLVCYLFAIVSLYALMESDSATSLLAMMVAGALSTYIYIAFRFQLGFIRMVVLALLLGGLVGFAFSSIDTAQLVGRSGDLTGRGEVWAQTWKLIMERPVTGYGYGSLWFPNDDTLWIQQSLTDFTWVVYHAHNGFLQVASEVGLPLSCIALLMVAQQLIEIFYCQYERQQVGVLFVLAFVVAYLISNFSEARFLVNRELFWIFFLALPISMLRQINVVSTDTGDEEAESEGPYGGAAANKPWLQPVNPGRAPAATVSKTASLEDSAPTVARPARKGSALGLTTAQAPPVPVQPPPSSTTRPAAIPGSRRDVTEKADVDLGSAFETDFDVGSIDDYSTEDATLDTTQVAIGDDDLTLEFGDNYLNADLEDDLGSFDETSSHGTLQLRGVTGNIDDFEEDADNTQARDMTERFDEREFDPDDTLHSVTLRSDEPFDGELHHPYDYQNSNGYADPGDETLQIDAQDYIDDQEYERFDLDDAGGAMADQYDIPLDPKGGVDVQLDLGEPEDPNDPKNRKR